MHTICAYSVVFLFPYLLFLFYINRHMINNVFVGCVDLSESTLFVVFILNIFFHQPMTVVTYFAPFRLSNLVFNGRQIPNRPMGVYHKYKIYVRILVYYVLCKI